MTELFLFEKTGCRLFDMLKNKGSAKHTQNRA